VDFAELVGRDEDEEGRKRDPQLWQARRGIDPADQERQNGDREQHLGCVGRGDVSLAVEVEDSERRPGDDGEHAEHAQERDDDAVRRRDPADRQAHSHTENPVKQRRAPDPFPCRDPLAGHDLIVTGLNRL
jgi:hypothetical protein